MFSVSSVILASCHLNPTLSVSAEFTALTFLRYNQHPGLPTPGLLCFLLYIRSSLRKSIHYLAKGIICKITVHYSSKKDLT